MATPSAMPTTLINAYAAMRMRRRSARSVRAPLGSARRKLGSDRAACSSATTNALAPSEAMSQAEVASCIDIETFAESQSARSRRYRGDSHGEAERAVGAAAGAGPGDSRATAGSASRVASCFTRR